MDHMKRFEQVQDDVKSIMGKDWLHNFVENTEEHTNASDTNKQNALKEESNEQSVACAFLRNCDDDKHGSLKKSFQTQCALNNNQCPKKTSSVSDALSSHQWDPAHDEKKKKRKQQRQESQQNNDNNGNGNSSNNKSEMECN